MSFANLAVPEVLRAPYNIPSPSLLLRRATFNHAKTDMKTRFACVYGVSTPVARIAGGDCFSMYREHATISWFVFEDLGREVPLS